MTPDPQGPRTISLSLRIWRQEGPEAAGAFQSYRLEGVSTDLSLLEALDRLNEQLISAGERPVHMEHDCREGICGSCGLVIDGIPHGPDPGATTCQVHMRRFRNGG